MTDLSEILISHWNNIHASTLNYAKTVPEEEWSTKAFNPRFKSFAWEFACLSRTRKCYINGFRTGRLTFVNQEGIPDKDEFLTWKKGQIITELEKSSLEIIEQLQTVSTTEKLDMAMWLFEHERLHQGKLILCFAKAEIPIPADFKKTWGEDNFPKNK